jgi:hypothetical protein
VLPPFARVEHASIWAIARDAGETSIGRHYSGDVLEGTVKTSVIKRGEAICAKVVPKPMQKRAPTNMPRF